MMRLPTEKEINLHNSLDEQSACRNFLGKTVEQAEALFRENAIYYQEDLMWMGGEAFVFYVPAYMRYLMSAASAGNSDAASCFAGLLEFRSEYCPESIIPVAGELAQVCAYIMREWEKFSIDAGIYGNLAERFVILVGRLKEFAENASAS